MIAAQDDLDEEMNCRLLAARAYPAIRLRLEVSESLGRYLVADCDIPANTTVLIETAVAALPRLGGDEAWEGQNALRYLSLTESEQRDVRRLFSGPFNA